MDTQPPPATRSQRAWYKRYPADALNGMQDLSCEEKGAYNTVLDLIYMRGGPIEDDPQYIARRCGCSTRRWNQLRQRLIDLGKLVLTDTGRLSNPRSERQIRAEAREAEAFQANGHKGAEKKRENSENIKDHNEVAEKGLRLVEQAPESPEIARPAPSGKFIWGKTREQDEIKSGKNALNLAENPTETHEINDVAEKGLAKNGLFLDEKSQHRGRVLRKKEREESSSTSLVPDAACADVNVTALSQAKDEPPPDAAPEPRKHEPLIDMRFMPPRSAGLKAWRPFATSWEKPSPIEPEIPCAGRYQIPFAVEAVCQAARYHNPHHRTDWSPLIRWMRDGIDLHAVILPVIRHMASLPGYQPPTWLSAFDKTIRQSAASRAA